MAVFEVTASNSCGSISYKFEWKASVCGAGGGGGCNNSFAVSPNPASTVLVIKPDIPAPCNIASGPLAASASSDTIASAGHTEVSATDPAAQQSTAAGAATITGATPVVHNRLIKVIRIFDEKGTARKTMLYGSGTASQVQLDVSDLNPGIYFVEITGEKSSEVSKIIIRR